MSPTDLTATPLYKGFEYRVRLAVSFPLAWGEFLRLVTLNHYDYKCREVAKAGIVNGLCNTASDAEFPSSFPLDWSDFDLLTKIMEQARYHTDTPEKMEHAIGVNGWIRQCKAWIRAREEALAQWDAEQPTPGGR